MMALAVWVWRVRPDAPLNRTFALLVSLLAVSILFLNIGWVFYYLTGQNSTGQGYFAGTAGLLLVAVAALVIAFERTLPPVPARFHRGPPAWTALLVPLLYLIAVVPAFIRGLALAPSILFTAVVGIGINTFTAAVLYLIGRLALRYGRAATDDDRLRWQTATFAIALGGFTFFMSGASAVEIPVPNAEHLPSDTIVLVPLVLASLTWLWAGARTHGRLATATALTLLGLVLAGFSAAALIGYRDTINSGALGLLRIAGASVLAYGILRHQVFDIDLKVKWGIRRGTLVGIFLAVFIATTEIVSELVTERAGLLTGLAATAALVLLIGPMQRLADHIADRALPSVHDTPHYREERRREIYSAALSSALRDGTLTERERTVLATLADELGLTSREALDLERRATTA